MEFNGFNPDVMKQELVDGAAADTNIAVDGITTEDKIQSVLAIDPDNGTPASQVLDQTANCSITSDGNIQCTAITTGYDLWVTWWDRSGADSSETVKQIA